MSNDNKYVGSPWLDDCPFCGSDRVGIEPTGHGMYRAACFDCNVGTHPTFVKSSIADEWNRRAGQSDFKWIPVSTVPEPYTSVLLYNVRGGITIAQHHKYAWVSCFDNEDLVGPGWTHWMLLPKGPEEE